MANNQTLRPQSSPPSPSPSTVALYANSSNVLVSLVSGGAPVQVGTAFTGAVPQTSVANNVGVLNTGRWYGQGGNNIPATGLANPSVWVPITYNGSGFLLPAFAIA